MGGDGLHLGWWFRLSYEVAPPSLPRRSPAGSLGPRRSCPQRGPRPKTSPLGRNWHPGRDLHPRLLIQSQASMLLDHPGFLKSVRRESNPQPAVYPTLTSYKEAALPLSYAPDGARLAPSANGDLENGWSGRIHVLYHLSYRSIEGAPGWTRTSDHAARDRSSPLLTARSLNWNNWNNWNKTEGARRTAERACRRRRNEPAPLRVSSPRLVYSQGFPKDLSSHCRADSCKFGSRGWIRTIIHGFKARCPTLRRPAILRT